MEYRVILRWKDDGNIETFSNRSKRMDEIANEYDEYMTDGGSGFGMGWRDMDWSFNSDAIASQCMQGMMVDLHRKEFKQDHRSFDDTLDWLEAKGIEIYKVEIEPTEDLE